MSSASLCASYLFRAARFQVVERVCYSCGDAVEEVRQVEKPRLLPAVSDRLTSPYGRKTHWPLYDVHVYVRGR